LVRQPDPATKYHILPNTRRHLFGTGEYIDASYAYIFLYKVAWIYMHS